MDILQGKKETKRCCSLEIYSGKKATTVLFLWLLLPLDLWLARHFSAKLKGNMCFIIKTSNVWQIYSVTAMMPPSRHFGNFLSVLGPPCQELHKRHRPAVWDDFTKYKFKMVLSIASKCSWQQYLNCHFLLCTLLLSHFCQCLCCGWRNQMAMQHCYNAALFGFQLFFSFFFLSSHPHFSSITLFLISFLFNVKGSGICKTTQTKSNTLLSW